MKTVAADSQSINPAAAYVRRAILGTPITDEMRETIAHHIHAAASYLIGAQTELAYGPTGRVGHLAAHLGDAFQALETAREVFVRVSGRDVAGIDLSDFGWPGAAAYDEEAVVS